MSNEDDEPLCEKCGAEGKWIDGLCGDELCFAVKCEWDMCGYIEEECKI